MAPHVARAQLGSGGRARLSPVSVSTGKVKKELDPEDGHLSLDETTKLLQDLQEAQAERGGSRPSSNLSSLSNASDRDQHHLGKARRAAAWVPQGGWGAGGQQAGPGPGVLQAPTGTLVRRLHWGGVGVEVSLVNQGAWPENAGSMLGRAPAGRVRAVDPIVSSRREHRLLPASAPEAAWAALCSCPALMGGHGVSGGCTGQTSGPLVEGRTGRTSGPLVVVEATGPRGPQWGIQDGPHRPWWW